MESADIVNSTISGLFWSRLVPILLVGGVGMLATDVLRRHKGEAGWLLGLAGTALALVVTFTIVLG